MGIELDPLSGDSECHGLCLKLDYIMLLMDGQQQFAPGLSVMPGEFPDSTSKNVHVLFQPAKVSPLIQTELTTKKVMQNCPVWLGK